jgi:hypothetical protein
MDHIFLAACVGLIGAMIISCSVETDPLAANAVTESGSVGVELEATTNVFVFTNRTAGRLELRNELLIQSQKDNEWEERTTHHALRGAAPGETKIAPCITLAPGEALRAAPWDGTLGWPYSCLMEDAPSGIYRVAAHACEGSSTFYGPSFELHASP